MLGNQCYCFQKACCFDYCWDSSSSFALVQIEHNLASLVVQNSVVGVSVVHFRIGRGAVLLLRIDCYSGHMSCPKLLCMRCFGHFDCLKALKIS